MEEDFVQEVQEEGRDFAYELKIPQERIAVLIGKGGSTKKKIESEAKAKIDVDEEGNVTVSGGDAMSLFIAKDIVRAIARGFNPDVAMELLKTDYVLEILSLRDVVGKSHKSMERLKGRIIGEGGKSRRVIEELTGCSISVYGKTIGLIGEVSDVHLAHQAVAMLLNGSMHRTVFKFLEKKNQEARLGLGDLKLQ